MRFHKLKFFPNITGNYTINTYNDKEYINGHFTFFMRKQVDKVSKSI